MASQSSFDHRYNSFFVDYSLVPLLVQQNYIENARAGVYKNPKFTDVQKLEAIARAAGMCICAYAYMYVYVCMCVALGCVLQ